MTEWSEIPEEIKDHLHAAALRENELREHGTATDRVKSDWAKKFGAATAKLAAKYPREYPFPPEKPEELEEPQGMQKWAQDFQKRANVNNGSGDDSEPDWRERQFKGD